MPRLAWMLVSVALLSSWDMATTGPDAAGSGPQPTLSPPPRGRIRVAVVLTEGATMIDFAGPWEVFQDVMLPGRGAGHDDSMPFELYTVSDSKAPLRTSGGMTVVPEYAFDDAPKPHVVVVGAQRGSPRLLEWLRRAAADPGTDVVMSVCTGAFHLAAAGLLDGKPATTHHDFHDAFAARFPRVRLRKDARFVWSDERVATAGGLTSGIDLALHVVARYFGDAAARRTAEYMEYQGTGWEASKRAAHGEAGAELGR